jgi:prepilin-type N-terminal cleavage/methylation domain-containing protein
MPMNRNDRGVTLTELLVAMVVLGIILVPLGNAVIQMIRVTDDTTRSLNESHDLQTAAAYFAEDVQSTGTRDWAAYPYPLRQSVEQGAPATGGLYPCGTVTTPPATVRLAWDDPRAASSTPDIVRVAYVIVVAGTQRQLHRIQCVGSATPVSDIVLAHNLAVPGATVSCPTNCTALAVPASITLRLDILAPGDPGPAVTVVLSGQRRQI